MSKILIVQEKGGVGKSYLTRLLYLKAAKEKKETFFIDVDNASASTIKFFSAIKEKKDDFIKAKAVNLMDSNKKIDRDKFDSFLDEVSKLSNVVVDFGAASSEQFLYYLQETTDINVVELLDELGITIMVVVAGGGSIKESSEYLEKLAKIKGVRKITKIVANEFKGGSPDGKTLAEAIKADIQITNFRPDANSELQKVWDNFMSHGVTWADIESLQLLTKKRVNDYLQKIFDQLSF